MKCADIRSLAHRSYPTVGTYTLISTTDSDFGPIQARVDGIDDQIRLNDQRIADLDALLEARRARLEAEFVAMERALALLQNQNAALQSIGPVIPVARSNNTSQSGLI